MYNHNLNDKKWIEYWKSNKTYKFVDEKNNNKKMYILDMFPYPSGSGLHVGHPKGYTFTDVISRYKKMNGYNILHPMGWDAFGLPAEQYALENKKHPSEFTNKNIEKFKNQLISLGYCYDFEKEVNTTDPQFYRWTQWIFVQLYKKGLAEIKDIDVNWCEALGTVLADEEVLTDSKGNKVSERGKHPVIKKPMKQWVLKITKYADKLIDELELTDWPIGLKNIQTNWIGRSFGININLKIENDNRDIKVFTSRSDTIFGVTFIGVSIDHYLVKDLIKSDNNLKNFIDKIASIKEYERNKIENEKNGYFLNKYAIHPFTNKKIPIYVTDYVLSNYGNGAIMGVPAHDERDFLFAKKYKLPIIKVIENENECYCGDGKHINSDFINGLNIAMAIEQVNEKIIAAKIGNKQVNYKLKDWLFSRQRYWGEPFPVLFDDNGNIIIEENLPLTLPNTNNISPSGDGQSPLANLSSWVNVEIGGKKYKRETNTMPQWAGSCWYFLGYILKKDDGTYIPLNSSEAFELFKKWMPVDLYVGGQEHAVLHLLYSRFWYKFLYDIEIVPNKEPFQKIINQGMILRNGEKMSKSKGNVVNPDDIVKDYGADTLRLYELFMGPISASLEWMDDGVFGIYKWVQRVYRLFETKEIIENVNNVELTSKYNEFLKNVTQKIEDYDLNLAISEMMIFINECYKADKLDINQMHNFIKVLSCFAPFVAEEINFSFLKNKESLFFSSWPKYDETKIIKKDLNIPIQINGKIRDILISPNNITEDQVYQLAVKLPKIAQHLEGKTIVKKIYVKDKILNLIVK
ncbi:leucine--tRNA ligase [Malacoplasma muris]|uniref:leucine--tRNA ligase n=1 Tax=Malacoplasma muris TaxID=2119 RepID=UPI00398F3996